MRVFRNSSYESATFAFDLTRVGAQQAVIILDARDPVVREGDTDRLDSVRLSLATPEQFAEGNFTWREIGYVTTNPIELIRSVTVDFVSEPGDILVAQLFSGYIDESSGWKLSVLLDGPGTLPLIVAPSVPGELIEDEATDGSFVSSTTLDIHHIDAELQDEILGVQTVGVTVAFDGSRHDMALSTGQLLEKNMNTGATELLAYITHPVVFNVFENYFPDDSIVANFTRAMGGQSVRITDMSLTGQGAVFGFEVDMPDTIGGFTVARSAVNAYDGQMLITRTGIVGERNFTAADIANRHLFDRFNADLSEIEVTYDESVSTLIVSPEVTLKNFIANGVDIPLHFSGGRGFIVYDGDATMEGNLTAVGSYRVFDNQAFRLTLDALTLDLSDPSTVNLRTGVSVDIGFGYNIHLPVVEARVGVTPDFALDELVVEVPTIFPELPVAPPLFFLTSATLGLYGLAPGGAAERASLQASFSIFPSLELPGQFGTVLGLGEIAIVGQLGSDGFQGTSTITLGSFLGSSLFTLAGTTVIDRADRSLSFTGTAGLGIPIIGDRAIVNSFSMSGGLSGYATINANLTFATPDTLAWALSFAGVPNPFAVTFAMSGEINGQGTFHDQYIQGQVDLGVLGFEVKLGARLHMDGDLQFYGYNVTDTPDFVVSPPSSPEDMDQKGMDTDPGHDIAMRTVGDVNGMSLVGPDGTKRSLAELEADTTDGITIQRDATSVSVFISDAAAGRWAIEAAVANEFFALTQQETLQLTTQLAGTGANRRLQVTATAPDGGSAGAVRVEVYRDVDGEDFDGAITTLALTESGFAEFDLASLALPEGNWNLHVRASAEGFVDAQQYVSPAVPVSAAEIPDLGIVNLRWVEVTVQGAEGEQTEYQLEATLRQYGLVAEQPIGARVALNGQEVEILLPSIGARETQIFILDLGQTFPAPARAEELRATLTLISGAGATNLANNTATAALYTGRDGLTSNFLLGTSENDVLRGQSGQERLRGLGGNDRLLGEAGNDVLDGGAGNDTLNGGLGADSMKGGTGNDAYHVDDAGDTATEFADGGTDSVNSTITYTLGDHLENLTLAGTAAINGTGNAFANRITGNAADNVLTGGAGNDNLNGAAGNDILNGGEGNDTLNGSLGADVMTGGTGNDAYHIDDAGDTVSEVADGGADTVNATITYTLGDDIENLTLAGTAAINGTGNALANRIAGNAADNVLTGGEGNDNLSGAAGNDVLDGGAGNDTLNGGIGADAMTGGTGNDAYHVDDAGDSATEFADGGTDTVNATITYTLSDHLENLTLTGTAAINGTGNALTNRITGNAEDNVLTGGEGNDNLNGAAGNDVLNGDAGNDTLNGGLGADAMTGGTGNDAYYVDDAGDTVSEFADGGADTVSATITYTLGDHLENLTLSGAAATNGTGNALANRITGNTADNVLTGGEGNDNLNGAAGNDVLDGGAGNDTLNGGLGADQFVFQHVAGGLDFINGFSVGEDRIVLSAGGFGGDLVSGESITLVSGALPQAGGPGSAFLYNTSTCILSFDADGNGANAAVQFARFNSAVALTASDFLVIA